MCISTVEILRSKLTESYAEGIKWQEKKGFALFNSSFLSPIWY